jgi:uncharacterized protein
MDLPDQANTNLFNRLNRVNEVNRVNRLIIFTRYPELGKNKTRLIPAFEDTLVRSQAEAKATDIHRHLAEHTLAQSRQWLNNQYVEMPGETTKEVAHEIVDKTIGKITVCFTGGDDRPMAAWLGQDLDYQPQGAGDLGQRILFVLQNLRESNPTRKNYFVIIGTDCPDLTSEDIDRAFQALKDHDLVLGKAEDGGYYLIGFQQIIPQLFQDIAWGTDTVFAETVAIANNLDLQISYLPVYRDIDRPEDLDYLRTLSGFENI